MNQETEGHGEPAAFNMAISTLMRVDNILKEITNLELKRLSPPQVSHSQGHLQGVKRRLVRQLYLNAIPLIRKKDKPIIKKKLMVVKLKLIPVMSGGKEINEIDFQQEIDDQLDEIIIDIQESLQAGGYLMPGRGDAGSALSE